MAFPAGKALAKTSPTSSADSRTRHWLSPGTFGLGRCIQWLGGNPSLLPLGAVYLNKERVLGEQVVRPGDYLRVHTKPKRYPVAPIRWRDRIVMETLEFLAVDKPTGIPVHPTMDNVIENVKVCLETTLGFRLYTTVRLDIETQGLLVFAKSPAFLVAHNRRLARRAVQKEYRALVTAPPPLGPIRHWMRPSRIAPREVSLACHEDWCVSIVLSTPATFPLLSDTYSDIASQLSEADLY